MRLLVCALIFVVNLPTTIATSTYCDTDGLARLRPWAAILLIREWGVPRLTSTRSLLPLEEHLSLRQMAWMSLRFRGRRDFGIFAKRTTAFRFLRRVLPFRSKCTAKAVLTWWRSAGGVRWRQRRFRRR
jgi:hypothetical protein